MYSLGFIGAGHMGGALIDGLRRDGEAKERTCLFFDPSPLRQAALAGEGVVAAADIAAVMAHCDDVIIAVKPQIFPSVAAEVAAGYRQGQRLLSVMAGIPLATIAQGLPADAKVVRLMPNMAVALGAGVTLMCANECVTADEAEQVKALLAPTGFVKEIAEKQMDVGTALSGSGPAFCYALAEGMILGGVRGGFTAAEAEELVAHTMKGAAALMLRGDSDVATLRNEMMSAGGTTVEGVAVLERAGFRGAVIDAVAATVRRSEALREGGK